MANRLVKTPDAVQTVVCAVGEGPKPGAEEWVEIGRVQTTAAP